MLRRTKWTHGIATPWRERIIAAAFGLACFAAATPARAHIILVSDAGPDTPKDWLLNSDTVGDPQKPTPCGGTGTLSNVVTTFQGGQSVTVTWIEAIAHSGHFRIAFAPVSPAAATATTLPDPAITEYLAGQGTPADSGTAEAVTAAVTPDGDMISSNGIVLADNLFPHCMAGDPCPAGLPVTAAPKTYSTTVTLPTTACTNCTLQVLQFMSYHLPEAASGGFFFYHHCAAITIVAAEAGAVSTPGEEAGGGGGTTEGGATTGTSGATSGTTGTTGTTGGSAGGDASSIPSGTSGGGGGGGSGGGTVGSDAGGSGNPDASGGATGSATAGSSSSGSSGCSLTAGRAASGLGCVGGLAAGAVLVRRRRRRVRSMSRE
jgi:hypothetical protein